MLEADDNFDGEISFVEFQLLMLACERDGDKQKGAGKGMWSAIRERGLVASREQKASADMFMRRIVSRDKRIASNERALAEAKAKDPELFEPQPWSPPLNPGTAGMPPIALVQLRPSVLSPDSRTYDVRETLRRAPWSKDRGKKDQDVESALLLDDEDGEEQNCLVRFWQSLPTPAEAVATVFDFFDNYAPLIAMLTLPVSALVSYLHNVLDAYLVPEGTIAPPPPPASPDWVAAASESFFDLAKAEPVTYLVLDLGLAFAIGTLAFFWKDITDWLEARRLRAFQQVREQRTIISGICSHPSSLTLSYCLPPWRVGRQRRGEGGR